MEVSGPRGESLRQHPVSPTDLEHDVVTRDVGEPLDDVEDVGVDEEVLAELARAGGLAARARTGARSAHHPNAAPAAPSIDRSSAAYSTRRSTASAIAVATTLAGLFGLPRTTCGERYGASVSTSRRSAGTFNAAVPQCLSLRVRDVAGEREQPARFGQAVVDPLGHREAVQDDPQAPRLLAQRGDRVLVGGAGVDDERLAGLAGELDLRRKGPLLVLARGVVAVEVEAGLADGDALLVRDERL